MFFFDKKTCGFYHSEIHPTIPEGAVEITSERHSELMLGTRTGKVIVADKDGYPVLVDPPPPSIRQQREQLKAELEEIDRKSIRPLRDGETAVVSDLTRQAAALRAQLSALEEA